MTFSLRPAVVGNYEGTRPSRHDDHGTSIANMHKDNIDYPMNALLHTAQCDYATLPVVRLAVGLLSILTPATTDFEASGLAWGMHPTQTCTIPWL